MKKAILSFIVQALYLLALGLSIGGMIEVWKAGLTDSAVVMALLLVCVVQQGFKINRLESAQPVARTLLSEEAEQAEMFRWLRDNYHGFEHYRSDFAKKQNLFENDIRKQMGIAQEKQG